MCNICSKGRLTTRAAKPLESVFEQNAFKNFRTPAVIIVERIKKGEILSDFNT